MQPDTPPVSKGALWTGRVLSTLVGLFLLFDGVAKLFKPDWVVKPTVELGYKESAIIPLGIALTVSALLYLIPRTAVIGAILLTGYLGGAVDANVRADKGAGLLFPVVFGVLVWLGILLRNPRLRAVLPLTQ
jgi:hypothetical protein